MLLLLVFSTTIFHKIESTKEGIYQSLRFPRSFQSTQKALIGGAFISAAALTANVISGKNMNLLVVNIRFFVLK